MKKPNIMLILCDQFRWDCLSIMGHPTVDTPNLDSLAHEGVLFTNGYSPAPSCVPARASLFTGKSPNLTGFLGYIDGREWNYENMLPEILRDNGYQTHCVGKTHFYPQRKHCGFEGLESYEAWQKFDNHYTNDYHEWLKEKTNGQMDELDHGLDDNSWIASPSTLPSELHNNSWVVTKGLEFIRKRDHSRPYFLNLSFHRPHPPIDPPKVFWDEYIGKELEEVPVGEWASKHDRPVHTINTWSGRLSGERLRKARLGYYAQIAHIDNQIGRLIRSLKATGEMPDMIIFTADHGEMLGDHHLFRKTYAYEGSAAIPFIVWEKGKQLGRRELTPVVLQDVYTTILDCANIEKPEDVDGLSLMSLINEGEVLDREWIHGEHSRCYSAEESMQFMTDGKKKYIWFTEVNKEQLFDLENDPYECHDLAADAAYEDELQVWRKRMIDYLATRPEDGLSDGKTLIPGGVPAYRKKEVK
ncbi:MAG: arylsulfatase [Niameybacter sp.]|uniref:arylsulfatase n=1 Tax=Niameybacter sp. TaxID=2033640 RepID=UPI002FCB4F40